MMPLLSTRRSEFVTSTSIGGKKNNMRVESYGITIDNATKVSYNEKKLYFQKLIGNRCNHSNRGNQLYELSIS